MGGRETHPRRIIIRDVGGAARNLDKGFLPRIIEQAVKKSSRPLDLVETHEGIDLGKLDGEIGGIPLGKTPPDDEFLSGLGTVKAATMCFEDRPDALLLGRIDESAGVDKYHVCFIGLRGEFVAVEFCIAENNLGVDEVLGATEADQSDFALGVFCCHRSPKEMGRVLDVIQGMERTLESWRIIPQVVKKVASKSRITTALPSGARILPIRARSNVALV